MVSVGAKTSPHRRVKTSQLEKGEIGPTGFLAARPRKETRTPCSASCSSVKPRQQLPLPFLDEHPIIRLLDDYEPTRCAGDPSPRQSPILGRKLSQERLGRSSGCELPAERNRPRPSGEGRPGSRGRTFRPDRRTLVGMLFSIAHFIPPDDSRQLPPFPFHQE